MKELFNTLQMSLNQIKWPAIGGCYAMSQSYCEFKSNASLFMLDLQQVYLYTSRELFVDVTLCYSAGRQACTRKSHRGCPSRPSEKRRAQGVFPLEFTMVESYVFKQLPTGMKIQLDLQFYIGF